MEKVLSKYQKTQDSTTKSTIESLQRYIQELVNNKEISDSSAGKFIIKNFREQLVQLFLLILSDDVSEEDKIKYIAKANALVSIVDNIMVSETKIQTIETTLITLLGEDYNPESEEEKAIENEDSIN
jgi:hypothetical protein